MDSEFARLIDRIRAAAAQGAPLRIRGGDTKDFYGEQVQGEPLDTRRLAGVTDYEPSELVVTARAGTPLAELEDLLAQRNQCLPFEPPRFAGGGTVGGMVAAGLSGPARASVGAVRDFVLGLRLVNGRGEHLAFGGQVMKNVAGYDVSRLMAGAMGMLGLITEVSLKILPRAPAEATLRFDCCQAEALRLLHGWGAQPLPLNASRWVEDGGAGVLFVRLRGAVAAVQAACRTMGGTPCRDDSVPRDWDDCRDQRLPWFTKGGGHDLWRLSVPQTAPVLDLPAAAGTPLVEWHGGLRWYRVPGDAGAAAALRAAAAQAGGHATLFRAAPGAAAGTAAPRFAPLAPALARIHRELRRQFDPASIFNPGRMAAD
ncbi:glycolate oxidase subunit GlcE [Ramlibacter sp. H39-3-26]|uniref:glycolate oxidase subunit GlcE n=1 Tax=Curvibacter soli TaxID=3031331 RepID=UPI0023DCAC69|nr:glycolate oxidase subunit GlcE [Ramlibacter sp. H39-3-26]MDF1486051.1 glycolate oxidase subunit GlcE [Ramlibacter sp. H39-3-26]